MIAFAAISGYLMKPKEMEFYKCTKMERIQMKGLKRYEHTDIWYEEMQ